MKKIIVISILLGLVGCVTNTPLIVEVRDSGKSYGDWEYYTYDDDFDGRYLVSMVKSDDNRAVIRIFTSTQANKSSFQYRNGDSYICTIYSGVRAEMIFTNKNGERQEHSVYLSRSDSAETLIARPLGGNEGQLVPLLNKYDRLKIRTTDDCGNRIDRAFNISGMTHLKPYGF